MEYILEDNISVCVWRRPPDLSITGLLGQLSLARPIEVTQNLDADSPELDSILRNFPAIPEREHLAAEIRTLVEVFATISDCRSVGLRLAVTRERTCPRFHVDRIALRLLCTWQGAGTEWLEHQAVDRRFLGMGAGNLPDETSGLLQPGAQIHRLRAFDVALLKGECYPGNGGRGAVHRSPANPTHSWRVMISLDDTD